MKRHLYLVRHAQSADKQLGQSDHERELTPAGRSDAQSLGIFFSRQNFFFDQVHCSTALRARQTLEEILCAPSLPQSVNSQFSAEWYHGTAENYLQLIKEFDQKLNRMLVIGHNPSISQLVDHLCQQPFTGLTPGSLVILCAEASDWKHFTETKTSIQFFKEP